MTCFICFTATEFPCHHNYVVIVILSFVSFDKTYLHLFCYSPEWTFDRIMLWQVSSVRLSVRREQSLVRLLSSSLLYLG